MDSFQKYNNRIVHLFSYAVGVLSQSPFQLVQVEFVYGLGGRIEFDSDGERYHVVFESPYEISCSHQPVLKKIRKEMRKIYAQEKAVIAA